MDQKTVGIENLPNVFIDKIYIEPIVITEDLQVVEHLISLKLCMYDHFPNRSWKRSEMSDLKIKVFFASDPSLSGLLSEGETNLFQFDVGARNDSTGEVMVFSVSALDFVEEETITNMNEPVLETGAAMYTKFTQMFEARISNSYTDLSVYVACYIDDIGFGIDLFDKYYGPMSGEKIFVGGLTNKTTSYFYYPDTNKEYGGPVHQHSGGGYMEGSAHSASPHKTLRLVEEENNKIIHYDVPEGQTNGSGTNNEDQETILEGEDIGSGSSQTYTPPSY